MRIVIAPDAFKGSMTSSQAAKALERGIVSWEPTTQCTLLPLADGGEGMVDAVLFGRAGTRTKVRVLDPLGRPVEAHYAWFPEDNLVVIEMAQASGLPLLGADERNPAKASSFGTGQLIGDALDHGATTIVLGLGGSATVDGGFGCLQALGMEFFAESEKLEWLDGTLDTVTRLDRSGLRPELGQVEIILATDVTNPLLGPEGAVHVFGPQKGLKEEELEAFERGMESWSELLQTEAGCESRSLSGAGAAGGIGFALSCFAHCRTRPGFDVVAEFVGLEDALAAADLLVTGEGSMDAQSFFGKVPLAAAAAAKRFGVPTIAVAGQITGSLTAFREAGIVLTLPIVDGIMPLEQAMSQAEVLTEKAGLRLAGALELGRTLRGVLSS